jgi:hypothetical protein
LLIPAGLSTGCARGTMADAVFVTGGQWKNALRGLRSW